MFLTRIFRKSVGGYYRNFFDQRPRRAVAIFPRGSMRLKRLFGRDFATILLALCVVGMLSFGCALKLRIFRKPDFSGALRVENIEDEIARLETAAGTEKDPMAKSNRLFHLAVLYSHHNNSSPDYRSALERLEEYASLNPTEANTDAVLYLRSLLQQIENGAIAYEKLTQNELRVQKALIETLERKNKGLMDENERLDRNNQKMKQVIEELKHLDIRLERKRKKY